MLKIRKITSVILIILTAFLSLTGMMGGAALILDYNTPPVSQLEGSVFKSFLIPGIALFAIVGGSALLAALLLIRKNKFSGPVTLTAGFIIMFFEFIEVLVIGSPPGVARTLQVIYFGLGTIITVFSAGLWFLDLYNRTKEKSYQ
jgi:hypothetical protein